MDPVSTITAAIVAGATVAMKDTASNVVKDAYEGLKRVISDGYKLITINLIETNPDDPAFKAALESEIKKKPELLNDSEILKRTNALNEALKTQTDEQLTAWGLVARDVRAAKDITFERISGTGGGVRVDNVTSTEGSIRFADLHGGGEPKK